MIHQIIGVRLNKYVLLSRILESEIKKQNLIKKLIKHKTHQGVENIIAEYENFYLGIIKKKIIDKCQEQKINIYDIINTLKKYDAPVNDVEQKIFEYVNLIINNILISFHIEKDEYYILVHISYEDKCIIGYDFNAMEDMQDLETCDAIKVKDFVKTSKDVQRILREEGILSKKGIMRFYTFEQD